MSDKFEWPILAAVLAFGLILAPIAGSNPAQSDTGHGKEGSKGAKIKDAKSKATAAVKKHKAVDIRLLLPKMDSAKGMRLFASKGCVTCHAVNGVGGHDAASLDAHTMDPIVNPFELMAKMWRMAPVMIAAQEEALGAQILFNGEEISNIIAFIHDDNEQHKFKASMIPPEIQKFMNHEHGGKPAHNKEIGHKAKKTAK